jgi:hypothetical protein
MEFDASTYSDADDVPCTDGLFHLLLHFQVEHALEEEGLCVVYGGGGGEGPLEGSKHSRVHVSAHLHPYTRLQ